MSLVKVKDKYQVTLPVEVRRKAGVVVGDLLEARVKGKLITLTPTAVVNRDALERRLAEGLEDVRQGRVHGPYSSARALVRSLQSRKAPRKRPMR